MEGKVIIAFLFFATTRLLLDLADAKSLYQILVGVNPSPIEVRFCHLKAETETRVMSLLLYISGPIEQIQFWGYPKNVVVVELEEICFSFTDEQDMEKILNWRPYVVDSQLLNIQLWIEP